MDSLIRTRTIFSGVISDMTGTHTLSFVVAGIGIFLSSFFVLAPVFYRDLEPNSNDKDHQPNNNMCPVNHTDEV